MGTFMGGQMSLDEHPNVPRLRAFFQAFANRNFDAIKATFATEFVWHVSIPSRFAGDRRGWDEFAKYLVDLGRETGGTMRIEPYEIFANDDRGVALVEISRVRRGKALSNRAVQVVDFRNGLITEGWFLDANPLELEGFYNSQE